MVGKKSRVQCDMINITRDGKENLRVLHLQHECMTSHVVSVSARGGMYNRQRRCARTPGSLLKLGAFQYKSSNVFVWLLFYCSLQISSEI